MIFLKYYFFFFYCYYYSRKITNNYESLLQQIDNVEMFENVIKQMQENLMEIFQTYERFLKK